VKDTYKTIDNYLKGLLGDSEKASFEMDLANDEDLQQEVNFRKAIVHHFKFEQIKQTIEQAKKENEQEAETKLESVKSTIEQAKTENKISRQKRIRLYRRLSIAAIFALIIGASFLQDNKGNENFFTKIVVPEKKLQDVSKIRKERIYSLVDSANLSINQKKFDNALILFNKLRIEEEFETDEILLNESYIFFKQGNYTKANKHVNNIRNIKLQNEVRKILSKMYTEVGEIDLAQQLHQIQNDEKQDIAIENERLKRNFIKKSK